MTGPLSEFVAAQHVKDLLDDAERHNRHRDPGEDSRRSRPTLHAWRRGRGDSGRRTRELPRSVVACSDAAAIESDRRAFAKAR